MILINNCMLCSTQLHISVLVLLNKPNHVLLIIRIILLILKLISMLCATVYTSFLQNEESIRFAHALTCRQFCATGAHYKNKGLSRTVF